MIVSEFKIKYLPQVDLDALRKNICPWCLNKLSPVFELDDHVADECLECDDIFK